MSSDPLFNAAVYVISVAAELAGMHPQTLRQYDRLGLVTPSRTKGRGRRYSPADIALLRRVQELSQEDGINLAGIRRIIELEKKVNRLQRDNAKLREIVARDQRIFAANASGEVWESALGRRPIPGVKAGARRGSRGGTGHNTGTESGVLVPYSRRFGAESTGQTLIVLDV
ncbi:MAG: helix-turn-helix transcriptional regulator [Actinomycetaceae bacterium]|nr:helix-turn-helix transcriptional regulator [Actinomycetaceae bacterium]